MPLKTDELQVTNLAWGAASFADGYQRTNTTAHVKDLIKWGADFLVASWNNQAQAYVAVLGNNSLDFNYYGPVEEYEQYIDRPAFYINAQAPGLPPASVNSSLQLCVVISYTHRVFNCKYKTKAAEYEPTITSY